MILRAGWWESSLKKLSVKKNLQETNNQCNHHFWNRSFLIVYFQHGLRRQDEANRTVALTERTLCSVFKVTIGEFITTSKILPTDSASTNRWPVIGRSQMYRYIKVMLNRKVKIRIQWNVISPTIVQTCGKLSLSYHNWSEFNGFYREYVYTCA